MSLPSDERAPLPPAEAAEPVTVPSREARASHGVPAGTSVQTDSGAVQLDQMGPSGSLQSESGDTGLDRPRGSGTSCDPSSEEHRREVSRSSVSEHNEAGSDTKKLQSKRLNQNRLAARKSRQRRKEYVEDLEEQVRSLTAELSKVRGLLEGRVASSLEGRHPVPRGSTPAPPSPAVSQIPNDPLGPSQWQAAPAAAVPNPFLVRGSQLQNMPGVAPPGLSPVAGGGGNPLPISLVFSNLQTAPESASREVLHAFERWHAQHAAKVGALLLAQDSVLREHDSVSLAEALAQHVAVVLAHLAQLFQLKRTVLQGPEAHAVLSLQHLPKAQRCFAPLGILSCSDLCAGLMHKLAPTLDPHQALLLEQTRNAVMGREAQLHVVLAGTMAEVTQAVAQTCAPQGTRGVLPPTLASLEMQAKLQIMCDVFMAADRLWEGLLQHTQQFLNLPQMVTVVCVLADTGAGLEEVWSSQARPSSAATAPVAPPLVPPSTCQAPLT